MFRDREHLVPEFFSLSSLLEDCSVELFPVAFRTLAAVVDAKA